jgi:hypothetical protein
MTTYGLAGCYKYFGSALVSTWEDHTWVTAQKTKNQYWAGLKLFHGDKEK